MQWFRACPASKSPSSISAAQTSRQRPWTREHQAQTKGRSMATPGVCRSLESLALRLTQANAPIMPSTEGTAQSGSVSVWYWRQCARASALARVDKANWWGRVASSMCCAKPGGEGSPRQSTRQQPASYPGLTRLEHSFSMSLIPGWRMMTQHLPHHSFVCRRLPTRAARRCYAICRCCLPLPPLWPLPFPRPPLPAMFAFSTSTPSKSMTPTSTSSPVSRAGAWQSSLSTLPLSMQAELPASTSGSAVGPRLQGEGKQLS